METKKLEKYKKYKVEKLFLAFLQISGRRSKSLEPLDVFHSFVNNFTLN